MTKERYAWYRLEIERLKALDKLITDRVRATYSLITKTKTNGNQITKILNR